MKMKVIMRVTFKGKQIENKIENPKKSSKSIKMNKKTNINIKSKKISKINTKTKINNMNALKLSCMFRLHIIYIIVILTSSWKINIDENYVCKYDPHRILDKKWQDNFHRSLNVTDQYNYEKSFAKTRQKAINTSKHSHYGDKSRQGPLGNVYVNDQYNCENSFAKTCQKAVNNSQHNKYGNKSHKGPLGNLKLLTFNKGSSYYPKHRDLILKTIDDANPSLCCITESNFRPNEKNLDTDLSDYNIENKLLPGLGYSRVSLLIKKGLKYQRLTSMENDLLSTIWVKVQVSRNKYIYIMAGYREHQYPKIMGITNSVDKAKQRRRFSAILDQLKKMSKHSVVCMWDSNVDMLSENNPLERDDIKEMVEEYVSFLEDYNFTIRNSKPTRY